MAHVLQLTGVKIANVKRQIEIDAAAHAEDGWVMEDLWLNDDEPNEVFFLFRIDDRIRCKQKMASIHAQARRHDPNAKLPEAVFLVDG